MSPHDFWEIVQQTRRQSSDEAMSLAALTAELARRGERSIAAFERQARSEIAQLDRSELRDVAEQLWVLPDEAWLNFRAWCVSQGQDFVRRVGTSPGAVLRPIANERGGPFDPPSGELFLYCAEYARVARTVPTG